MFLKIAQAAASTDANVTENLATKIASFFEYIMGQVPSWIAGFLLFIAAFFLAKMAKSAVESRISDQVDEEHQEVLVLAGRVTYFGTITVGITIALKVAGIDLTTILAAVAFGIGFALRDLIMNFLSGVMILVSKQFAIGDFIKVGNTVGKVMEIQTRATILKAIDGTKVIVPNSEIFTSQVVSFTTNPTRRVVIPLYISYDTNIEYAIKVTLDILKKHPKILKKPKPSVIVKDYGDSSIDLNARFWVGSHDGWFKIKSELMHKLWDEFVAAGIVVPYDVMHLETEQDTAQYVKDANETAKKRFEEMKLSAAIAQDQKTAAQKTAVQTKTAGDAPQPNGAKAPAAGPATVQTLAPAVQEAVVEPESEYSDLVEIDGQG